MTLSVGLRNQRITESLIHLTLSLSRGGTYRMGSGHSGPRAELLIFPFALSSSHLTGPRPKRAKMTTEQSDLTFTLVFPKIESRVVEIWQDG